MRLAIDEAANSVRIDGHLARGHRRWEAAALATLIRGGHDTAASACGATALNAALGRHGQGATLNRTQVNRLWLSLAAMFAEAGRASEFADRLQHGARHRTVGPWWWAGQPVDRVSFIGRQIEPQVHHDLPALCVGASHRAAAALCRHMMMCRAFVIDGEFEAADRLILDGSAWADATAEALILRALMLAELRLHRHDLVGARLAHEDACRRMSTSKVAGPLLGGSLRYLGWRQRYLEAPARSDQKILNELSSLLVHAPGASFLEADRLSRGLFFNLAALCERRAFERFCRRGQMTEAQARLSAATRYGAAAVFCFIANASHEYTQNAASNMAYALHRGCELQAGVEATDALAWYAVAQLLQNRFGLAENNVWDSIFLGSFWLRVPDARTALAADSASLMWAGRRPDELAFYVAAHERARQLGEPRQLAYAAHNLCLFAQKAGVRAEADASLASLNAVFVTHPAIEATLKAEGYRLPSSDRRAGRAAKAPTKVNQSSR